MFSKVRFAHTELTLVEEKEGLVLYYRPFDLLHPHSCPNSLFSRDLLDLNSVSVFFFFFYFKRTFSR
jgi:hypothetical protein